MLCLEVTAAEETYELHHLYHVQDHLRQLFQDLDSRSWACALLVIFLLSHQTVFHLIFSSETRNDFHKVSYNCLSIYVWRDTHTPETIFTKTFPIVNPSMYGKILIESVSPPWRKFVFYFTPLLMMLKCIENTHWK